jgi:hypothetical protein
MSLSTNPTVVSACIGPGINNVPVSVKIAQDPHHRSCPINQLMESHGIPDLVSSICRMLDLDGYDGSSSGQRWEYGIERLLKEYRFVDVWDHFRLTTPPCDKFSEEESVTISCKAKIENKPHSQFSPILVEMNYSDGLHRELSLFPNSIGMSPHIARCITWLPRIPSSGAPSCISLSNQ